VKIFINYRRDDTEQFADSLYKELSRTFGKESVFIDIHDIPPGSNFPNDLRVGIETATVVLVLIGSKWEQIIDERQGKEDYVVEEIEIALQLKKQIIPLLVNHDRYPNASTLPEKIHDLKRINSLEFPRIHFDDSFRRLVERIRSIHAEDNSGDHAAEPSEVVSSGHQSGDDHDKFELDEDKWDKVIGQLTRALNRVRRNRGTQAAYGVFRIWIDLSESNEMDMFHVEIDERAVDALDHEQQKELFKFWDQYSYQAEFDVYDVEKIVGQLMHTQYEIFGDYDHDVSTW